MIYYKNMVSKFAPVIFLLLLFIYGCGYTVVRQDRSQDVFNIKDIVNISDDLAVTGVVKAKVMSFFSHGKSSNTLIVTITDCKTDADYTSSSREAVKSDVYIRLHISVINDDGGILFDDYLSSSSSFLTGSSDYEYRSNKAEAVTDAVDKILNRFRYEFTQ